ncbi:hypothetical protein BKP56_05505 [Marinilactibacillus sp. 15R]|uniref:hypothetical protein n=1 Tax=Marinilactibacillus sp. 15R TaxID=1911586 RepID=UPI00090C33CF|nr:hypothetical protein [Marinilactibacillus sp. 15R]API88775.1 hypothetical protein BKP56_05505 [Marinilactibacillus sp. 15R]
MEFDLRTCDAAYYFVLNFMNMSPEEYIAELNIICENDFELFMDRNFERIKNVDISDIKVLAFHIVGSLDDCNEIKSTGLMNLQEVLKRKTILASLIKKQDIIFNIDNKIVSYGGREVDIDYEKYRGKYFSYGIDENLKSVAHRLYYDYCVNGFLINDNIFGYTSRIHERPEFLMTLSKIFPEVKSVEDYWIENSVSYRIDFYANLDQIHRFNFELDEHCERPDDDIQVKKWMLTHANERANNALSEQYIYINDDCIIPPHQIISYTRI